MIWSCGRMPLLQYIIGSLHRVLSSLSPGVLLAFGISPFIRVLAVGSLHKFLQLFLKAQITGRRCNHSHFRHGWLTGNRWRRCCFPFRFFFLRIRTVFSVFSVIKSGISRPVKKRNLWGVAAVVVGAILFMKAASLLLSADSGFNDRFIILGELIDKCLDWISKCFDEKFIVRFIFSIPVGCWLFGLMSGSARVRPEELEHERSFVAASLIKIRKVPARVWTFVIGAFSLLYLSLAFQAAQALCPQPGGDGPLP